MINYEQYAHDLSFYADEIQWVVDVEHGTPEERLEQIKQYIEKINTSRAVHIGGVDVSDYEPIRYAVYDVDNSKELHHFGPPNKAETREE